ncbi:hypothetical protein ABH982_005409 [Bradyrhizobium ottawaense]
MDQRVGVNCCRQIILEAAGEVECRFGRYVLDAFEQFGRAIPADLDAAEQIRLRARHLEQALRLERSLGAEDVGIGLEADARAAAVVDLAEILELALGVSALEGHAVELLAARDLDLEQRGEGVHHGDADAVQAAGGLVDLAVELAARMQRAHDDFERRFLRKFWMRVDRDAAAVVGDGQEAVRGEFDADEGRMSRQRLVHRVVDDLGEQMMQRLLIGAADIHAGSAPHRFQAFEHLDVGCRVVGFAAGSARSRLGRRARLWLIAAEKIVFCFGFQLFGHIS